MKTSNRIWSTPEHIFRALDREFKFSIDLCADLDNAKCDRFYLRGESLFKPWFGWQGWAFLNPPYGRELSQWVRKAADSGSQIVAMLPGRTNPPWWHDYALKAKEIRCVRRKVNFKERGQSKGVPMYGSVFAIFEPHEGPTICTSWDWREGAAGGNRQEPQK